MAEQHDSLGPMAKILSAYLSSAPIVDSSLVPGLIRDVLGALRETGDLRGSAAMASRRRATPSEIRKSITPDALISFIDSKPYKMLKRHLAVNGMNPLDYNAHFGLPSDYPMVAPNYSTARSEMSKRLGLGGRARKTTVSAISPAAKGAASGPQRSIHK